jgi:elongation factor 1-beta
MALTLKAPKGCFRSPKILIAAAYSKVEIKVVEVERDPKKGYPVDGPLKKTPVLETEHGVLFESNAIARFVARTNGNPANLFGKNSVEAAQVESWISLASSAIEDPLLSWIWSHQGKIENQPEIEKNASNDISNVLAALDSHLQGKTYLVGDQITLADIIVASSLLDGYRTVLDGKIQKAFKNTLQWFKNVVSQGPVTAVLGDVILAGEKTPCNRGDAGAAAEEDAGDDDFDVFGDDDEEDAAREAEIQRIADEAKAAKEARGKAVIEKSVVVLDVKPWDSETDLDALEIKIRGIEMEGLEWKSAEKKPIAYGVFKLTIMCHIVDKLVSVDDLQEKIAEFEDEVQSSDIASFSKL